MDNTIINKVIAKQYKITRKLGEGSSSYVYEAVSLNKNKTIVAVKILKSQAVSHRDEDIIRFFNEIEVLSRFRHERIIQLIKAGEEDQLLFIILESFHGTGLNIFFEQNRTFPVSKILDVIIHICEGLDYIHSRHCIHRDLKPGNILIKEDAGIFDTNVLKIIDFGFSRIKTPVIRTDSESTGSFHYMAPEQTGLFSHIIDERSDLYALGVIFYEFLTGTLPFKGQSHGAVIHKHITHTPASPSVINQNIPLILDHIVLKLLEKEPEKRYQSALGLIEDLKKLKQGITDFVPGAEDRVTSLNYRTKLIGRTSENRKLVGLIEQAKHGTGSICFIHGEPGVGKSRIANECGYLVFNKGGTFIEVKCMSGIKSTPFGAFKEALLFYSRVFVRYTKEEKKIIRENLKEILGELGRIIINLCPQSRDIIGDFPQLLKLNPDKEEIRFIHILSLFFLHLAKIEGFLVLCFDDMQWATVSTFKILYEMIKTISHFPLVILCFYRSSEVKDRGSLFNFIKTTSALSSVCKEFSILPFTYDETGNFIEQIFLSRIKDIKLLTDIIFKRSKGNPFFITEILKEMIRINVIYPHDNSWHINREELSSIIIPESIITIILNRLSHLAEQEINVFSLASVIGKKFTIQLLYELHKTSTLQTNMDTAEIVAIIEKGIQLQIIAEDSRERDTFLFLHDKIREAMYSRLNKIDLMRLHNLAGTLCEKNYDRGDSNSIYQIIFHFTKAQNQFKIIKYAFTAGEKAKEAYAFKDAVSYFLLFKRALEQNNLEKTPEWITCIEQLCKIYLFMSKNNKALKLYGNILSLITDKMRLARIYMNMSQAYFKKWDISRCEYYAKSGLTLLGEKWVIGKKSLFLRIPLEIVKHIVHMLFHNIFIKKKKSKDEDKNRLILWFYYSLCWMYVFEDTKKFIAIIYYTINLSVKRLGLSKEYAMYLGGLGVVCMSIPFNKIGLWYLKKSLTIKKQLGDLWGQGQSLQLLGGYYQFKAKYEKSNYYSQQSLEIMRSIGDVMEMQFSIQNLRNNYCFLGSHKEMFAYNLENYQLTIKAGDDFAFVDFMTSNLIIHVETGNFIEAEKLLVKLPDSELIGKQNLGYFIKLSYGGLLELYKGNIEEAIKLFEKAYDFFKIHSLLMQYSVYIYIFLFDGYLALLQQEQGNGNRTILNYILKKLKKFSRYAVKKTRHWPTYHGSALRTKAQYLFLKNKPQKAEKLFQASISHSKTIGRKLELAHAYFAYGHFLNKTGKYMKALRIFYNAYLLFHETNSIDFLQKTKNILGFSTDEETIQAAYMEQNDKQMTDMLKQLGELLGSEKPYTIVIDKILEMCMVVIGAQRGIIFKKDTESNDFEIIHSKSVGDKIVNFGDFSANVVYNVIQSGEPVISSDALSNEELSLYDSISFIGIKFLLCFPVKYNRTVRYICYFDNLLVSVNLTKKYIDTTQTIMNIAVAYIDNNLLVAGNKKTPEINRKKCEELSRKFKLTNREYTVLWFVLQGLTNKEIIQKTHISLHTLRTHLNHIYAKTDTENREELKKVFLK